MADGIDTAGSSQEGSAGPPRCEHCGAVKDDIEKMDSAQLLAEIKLGFLKLLARALRSGDATSQDVATARGLLKDNKVFIPLDETDATDDELPPQNGKMPLPERKFRDHDFNE